MQNISQFTMPIETNTRRMLINTMKEVAIIIDLGIIFFGFFASSERNVIDSQPMNVSEMKNMANNIVDTG